MIFINNSVLRENEIREDFMKKLASKLFSKAVLGFFLMFIQFVWILFLVYRATIWNSNVHLVFFPFFFVGFTLQLSQGSRNPLAHGSPYGTPETRTR